MRNMKVKIIKPIPKREKKGVWTCGFRLFSWFWSFSDDSFTIPWEKSSFLLIISALFDGNVLLAIFFKSSNSSFGIFTLFAVKSVCLPNSPPHSLNERVKKLDYHWCGILLIYLISNLSSVSLRIQWSATASFWRGPAKIAREATKLKNVTKCGKSPNFKIKKSKLQNLDFFPKLVQGLPALTINSSSRYENPSHSVLTNKRMSFMSTSTSLQPKLSERITAVKKLFLSK